MSGGLLSPLVVRPIFSLINLADKWGQPYSHVRGFLNARVSLCLVRASSLCLRSSRVPARKLVTLRFFGMTLVAPTT